MYETIINNIEVENEARYRCEQINKSEVDGNMVHFAEQKFQYLLQQSITEKIAKVKLEEHLYNFSPPVLNLSFEFISKTEFIKNNVFFTISEKDGKFEKVINQSQINKKWLEFRDNEFENSLFIKRLMLTNNTAVAELKELGNQQFSENNENAAEEYRRSLFYFICFDKFLVASAEEISNESFPFMSTIVPPVVVPVEFQYEKLSEDKEILKVRKIGTISLKDNLISEIEKKYDELHKPNIKYGFTKYKLNFEVNIEYNKKEKLVEVGSLFINEQIADNIENTCEFKLKRLKNYTP